MSDSRLGEIRYNTFGTPMKIIEYRSHGDITVEFLDQYRIQKNTTYSNFKIGQVRNPYDRNVKNVGYMGEGKYTSDGSQYIRRVFGVWVGMLERCYSEDMRHKYPAYEHCIVCDEWHNYQNFREWYDSNFYQVGTERMHIDKDILYKNNKYYSPKTCLIVPQRINMLFMKKPNKYGLPNGLQPMANGRYSARYNGKHIGNFDTVEEAAIAHDKAKKKYITKIANEYRDKIPDKAYQALINWIPDYIDYNETAL